MKEIEYILNLPWYAYFAIFLIVLFVLGKSKDWAYQAKLFIDGLENIQAIIKFKKYKNEDPIGEVLLVSGSYPKEGDLNLMLNGERILTMKFSDNGKYVTQVYPVGDDKKKFRSNRSERMKKLSFNLSSSFSVKNKDEVSLDLDGKIIEGSVFRD